MRHAIIVSSLSPKKLALIQARLEKEGLKTADSARIPRRSGAEPAALSFGQERLWFFSRMAPESAVFHIPACFRIVGPLDVPRLESAWARVRARHDTLRTRFGVEDGRAVMLVDATVPDARMSAVDVVDMVGGSESEAIKYARARAGDAFDLERGPLARLTLVRLGEQDHLLLLVIHHIVSEVQSLGVLVNDLAATYRTGEDLPALPIQFADFAAWQRERMDGALYADQLAWWKDKLSGELPVLQMPTDRPRPAVQAFEGATCTRALPQAMTERLREVCRAAKVTPFSATLAVWAALLARYSSQDDVLIGIPTTDRNRVELQNLIGFFVNTLAERVDLSGAPSFTELLRRVHEFHLGAQSNQELPFEQLVEELGVARDLSRSPIVQVAFLYQTATESKRALASLGPDTTIRPHEDPLVVHTNTSKFDAALVIWDGGDRMSASVEYSSALFDATTIERLLGHFERLLTEALADVDAPIASLPILSAAEEQLILVDWNETGAEIRRDACVDALFEEQVDRTPDAVAVTCGGEALTYRELDERANKLAHHLRKLGVGPDQTVAIATGRANELLVGILGTLKAGGAYVPIDLAYPKERLAFVFADAEVRAILTRECEEGALPEGHDTTETVPRIRLDADWTAIDGESSDRPERISKPTNLAYVIYTSGSTGTPKGVALEHTGLVNLATWHQRVYDVRPEDRATHLAGLAFDASVWEIWPYVLAGSSLHLVPEDVRLAPVRLIAWLAEHRISQSFLPTPLAEAVLREPMPTDFPLEVVFTGGDKLRQAPTEPLPFRLVNHYGPTENTVVATATEILPVSIEDADAESRPAPPIGTPIDNVQVYVLDAGRQPVPVGVPGELFIGGTSLARGYFGQSDLTAEKFISHPLAAEGRLYATGDLVRWTHGGQLEFLGRLDGQVKVRGFRIELGEVEAHVGKHAAVADCAVVIRPGGPGGPGGSGAGGDTGGATLIGYAVARPDQSITSDELRAHLRTLVPDYMVPAIFVILDEMPLTPNGKTDKRALPDPDFTEATAEHVDPEGELEEKIAIVWRDLLELDSISATRNFFDLGGHSLLLAQVHVRLQESIDPAISIVQLFRYPTVSTLAAHLANGAGTAAAQADQSRDRGARRREAMRGRGDAAARRGKRRRGQA